MSKVCGHSGSQCKLGISYTYVVHVHDVLRLSWTPETTCTKQKMNRSVMTLKRQSVRIGLHVVRKGMSFKQCLKATEPKERGSLTTETFVTKSSRFIVPMLLQVVLYTGTMLSWSSGHMRIAQMSGELRTHL